MNYKEKTWRITLLILILIMIARRNMRRGVIDIGLEGELRGWSLNFSRVRYIHLHANITRISISTFALDMRKQQDRLITIA